MNSKTNQLVIVDGYSFLFRAYHSMPPLSNPENVPVGAVYGFISMMIRLLKDLQPSHIVIVFDSGKKNFRHKIYPLYKANRPEAPEDLLPQFPLVREAAKALNVAVLEIDGYEADDVIATLAKQAHENKEEVLIVSSDKDLMQLVNSHIKMYDAIRNKIIGEKEVAEKWGVTPEKMLDLLAMVGDSSDNIPGLSGIGPKTAALLLNEYGSWEKVLEQAPSIKQDKRREVIMSGKEAVDLSKSLVTLYNNLELNVNFTDLKTKDVNSDDLTYFLEKQNFKSLIARVKKDFAVENQNNFNEPLKDVIKNPTKDVKLLKISTNQQLDDLIAILSEANNISIYFQTNFLHKDEVRKPEDVFAIAFDAENYCGYIEIGDTSHNLQKNLFEMVNQNGLVLEYVLKKLLVIFESNRITKILYDLKVISHIFDRFNLSSKISKVDDVMLMAYSAGSGRFDYDFSGLCNRYLSENDEYLNIGGITKSRKKLQETEPVHLLNYIATKVQNLTSLYKMVNLELVDHNAQTIYQKLELPLAKIIFAMEKIGVTLDCKLLSKLSQKFENNLLELETEIHKLAGQQFNIASPKQLSEVLFDHMGIEPPKKSKSGRLSTGVEVLEQLKDAGHTIADKLLEWRTIHKLKTTYTDALPKQVDPKTNRIHTNFSQALTSTGRLSSSDPNLQNIPIRSEAGQEIREAFVAKSGYKIISADYSQIELRILAHIANVESLKKAFGNEEDIHKITASEVFGVALSDVTQELRRKAKAINFGIIYGQSAFGLAKSIDISRTEAAQYIDRYFKEYPGIKEYINKTIEFARTHGYVHTLMGRRCYTPYINDKNFSLKSFAERAAINAPLQGSNADFIKKAMIDIDKQLGFSDEFRMILQVHDELLFEVKQEYAEKFASDISKIMENVVRIDVPIKVETAIANSWKKL